MEKGEIARYEQFLLFPQCFLKTYTADPENQGLFEKGLRYPDLEDRICNRDTLNISVVLKETTLTISDSNVTVSPVQPEVVRVVSLGSTEITEITRVKNPIFRDPYLKDEIPSYNDLEDTGL